MSDRAIPRSLPLVDRDVVGSLRYESPGGQAFPHFYAELDPRSALWVREVAWDGERHVFDGLLR